MLTLVYTCPILETSDEVSIDRASQISNGAIGGKQPSPRKLPGRDCHLDSLDSTEVARLIIEVASDNLAEDIVMLDLRDLAPFTDYFIIMSAESSRQIEALEEDLTKSLKDAKVLRHKREGTPASGWILLDFSDVIVHIFSPDEREFYDLERLWSRAPQVVRVL